MLLLFFFFNDTATTEIYTLSLHDALPISYSRVLQRQRYPLRDRVLRHRALVYSGAFPRPQAREAAAFHPVGVRSEEHTSELQSRLHLVCRLLLEKKKKQTRPHRQRKA